MRVSRTGSEHVSKNRLAASGHLHLMVMKFLSDLDILRPSMCRWPRCRK